MTAAQISPKRLKATEPRIQSVARVDRILEAIARAPGGTARLRQIVIFTGLRVTTALTLLQTLVALNLVERLPGTKTYRLGARLLQLGRLVEQRMDLLELARPSAVRLCQKTGAAASIVLPSANRMIVADSLEGDVRVKTTSLKGIPLPLHGSASGKCFLAFTSERLRSTLLRSGPLAKLTRRTIDDPSRLENDLKEIRAKGYATEIDEFQHGVGAVAAPIFDGGGRLVGTISLAGSSDKFPGRRLVRLADLVMAEAKTISHLLI